MAKKKNKGGNGGNNAENNNNGENKEENNNNNEGNKEEENNNNNNGGDKNNNGGEKKEENNNKGKNNATVLKVYMHCEGCANKVTKHLNGIKGVDTVKAESETGKVTVTGNVDPTKLRDNLAEKIKKKVELISPLPKKDNKKENEPNKKSDEKKNEDKKESITTSVLKLVLHCQGCIDKIGKIVMKTKGVLEMKVDKEKDNVTVKGTMDVKKLVENLSQKLKRKVEVVQPKKDKEGGGGEKEGNEGGGGGKKKNKGGGDSNNNEGGGGEVKIMEYMVQQPFGFGYGNANVEGYNAAQVYQEMLNIHMQTQPPQMFSDENPNACIVM